MLTYLLKRLVAMIPTLLGITFITFMIINLAPGDPVATSMGSGGAERSAEAGGGGQSQDRLADAIKAKKKLLGMVVEDFTVHGWKTNGGEELLSTFNSADLPGWVHAIAVADDSGAIVVAGDDGALHHLDPSSGETLATWPAGPDAIWSLAFNQDGSRIASGDISGVVRMWDAQSGKLLASSDALGRPTRGLAFLPDGRLIDAAEDGIIRIRTDELAVLQQLEGHTSGVYAIALSANAERLWSGGYDRVLREWDVTSGTLLKESTGHGQAINDIQLSANGYWLATACDDRKIRLFDIANEEHPPRDPLILEGHYKSVTSIAFSADGDTLISGSRDETIRAWSLADGTQIAQAPINTGRVHAVVATSTGDVLSGADSWVKVPTWLRYVQWTARVATLDFDRSFTDNRLVMDKISDALPITLYLNVIAITIIYLVSIPLGVWAAVKRGSVFDHVSSVVLFILYSIPNFWLATLLIMFFSSKQHWDILPSVGLHSDETGNLSSLQYLWDWLLHLILPIIVMVYAGFASLSRYARTTMLETIKEDYVRTARAKGLPERVVVFKHAFRNSLITIITLVANLLPAMIGGSVIVEYIFSINGMGKLGFDAILARDYPVIMAITTFSAFLTLLGILISDLLYTVVDPRVTAE